MVGPPPKPQLRPGFVVVGEWEAVKECAPPFTVSLPETDLHTGWLLWIAHSGAHPLPIHALGRATQADVDRLAFNACRKIDQALGLPVRK